MSSTSFSKLTFDEKLSLC
jgi:hypothetical protein